METSVLNRLSQSTVSCSSNRAVWVQHLRRFAEGMPLDKDIMENHFHYNFFQSVEALVFSDGTERILFCHSLGLFLEDERLPLLKRKGIIALKKAVSTTRYFSMNQLAVSFLNMGVIPECPVYQSVCQFIKKSKNRIPQSSEFWEFFFGYSIKESRTQEFDSLLYEMNRLGFLNKIKYSSIHELHESSLSLGMKSVYNLIRPILQSHKESTLYQKYIMISCASRELFNFREEVKQFNYFSFLNTNNFIGENDFSITGQFIKKFWLSESFWEIRAKLNLNVNPEKEVKKYSFISLTLFWIMIHKRSYLLQSLKKRYRDTSKVPLFPEGFTFTKMIKYLPKELIQNIRDYFKRDPKLFFFLAQGNNIRNYPNLILPLSKKGAYYCFEYLIQADGLRIATIKATLKCWGISDDEMHDCSVLNIKCYKGDYWKFIWQNVINSKIKIKKIVSISRIIEHFEITFREGHFKFKRDVENEINLFLKKELIRQKTNTWDYATFGGYSTKEGNIRYNIIQLNNPRLLQEEGEIMSHCVKSYDQSCKHGRCSIWLLRGWDENNKEKRYATIEVSRYNTISQVRGKANKTPDKQYRNIILEWAIQEDLNYSGN